MLLSRSRLVCFTSSSLALFLIGSAGPLRAADPDPKLLPVATTAQVPLTTAYDSMNVPAQPAGSFYLDPTTQVKIYKLTSNIFPAASGGGWIHDYSEGGDEVSLPYNGQTRAVLVRRADDWSYWLLDFTPGVGVGNPRSLSGTGFSPCTDLAFTFSNNPATPWYAYVSNCAAVKRIDIRTLAEAPGGGWPVNDANAVWMHQSENDGLFVWMLGANGSTMVAYEPGTGTRRTHVDANMNEPRIDRAGRYVALAMNTPGNSLQVWDWNTQSIVWSTPGDPGIPFAHNASLRRRWVSVDWNMSYPPDYTLFIPDVPNSAQHIGGPANGTLIHGNGTWIQRPADLNDQWAVFLHYGSLRPPESYWLAPGGMVLMTPNGQRRLLAHAYNTSGVYNFFSFAKFSSDGRYVLFTSDMDGSSRSDVFLAELPTSGGTGGPTSVTWTGLVNAAESGSDLEKSGGCDGCDDAGAVSQQQIVSGDGYVEVTATQTDTLRIVGLSHGNTDASFADVDFGIYLTFAGSTQIAEVRENGTWQADTTFALGDVFRVAVVGGVVKYYKNGTLFHTSSAAPTYPLVVDTSLLTSGARISNAVVSGAGTP